MFCIIIFGEYWKSRSGKYFVSALYFCQARVHWRTPEEVPRNLWNYLAQQWWWETLCGWQGHNVCWFHSLGYLRFVPNITVCFFHMKSFIFIDVWEMVDISNTLSASCLAKFPLLHSYHQRIAERPNIKTYPSFIAKPPSHRFWTPLSFYLVLTTSHLPCFWPSPCTSEQRSLWSVIYTILFIHMNKK